MSAPRIHQRCGRPMTASAFGPHNPIPSLRSQPVWSCYPCNTWEPREGWNGDFPAAWDGEKWTVQP